MPKSVPANHQKIIDNAWLGINVNESTLFNPLDHIPPELEKEPHMYVLWLMQQPEYFSFICKEVMGIELLPFQSLILKEMWYRKFPMLIASRGGSKALKPDELVLSENGWIQIKDIKAGDKVRASDGNLYNVNWNSGIQDNLNMYRITLRDGRTIDCCEDHMWKVWNKDKNRNKKEVVWSELSTKKIAKDYFRVRKDSKSKTYKLCKEYQYALPINQPIEYPEQEYILHPYVLGVLLGDGCMTHNTISITSLDMEIIDKVNKLLPTGYIISKYQNGLSYGIKRSDKTNKPFYKILEKIGIWKHNSHTKFIPKEYMNGSIEQRLELLRGLNDTDGYSNNRHIIFYTVSNQLSKDYLEVARSVGLSCRHSIRESWYNSNRYADCNAISIYTDKPVFSLSRKLKYLEHTKSKAGQSKFDKTFITNIEYVGKGEGCCISVDSPDHTYITKDYIVTHNSFMLALYTLLRILLLPGRRVVMCGAAFRQSKVIFNYMENIWYNAPLLRDMCGGNDGPRHEPDMFRFHIGDSTALAIPLGDGGKIRGLRASDIISDEFACLIQNTYIDTDIGLIKIKDYMNGDAYDLLNMNNEFETPTQIFKTPKTDVYKVTVQNGYSFECSQIHRVYTIDGWKLAKDLTKDDFLELSSNTYFPPNYVGYDGLVVDEKIAWLMGLLVSEGTVTNRNYVNITNTDKDLIVEVMKTLPDFDWKLYTKKAYKDGRGWDCKESYTLTYHNTEFRTQLYKLGIDYVTSHDKTLPNSILQSPRSVVVEFLRGLFTGDGSCFVYHTREGKKRIGVAYYSTSEELISELQILLLKFGITCTKTKRGSKLSDKGQWMLSMRGLNCKKIVELLNIKDWNEIIKDADYLCKRPHIRKNGNNYVVSTTRCNRTTHLGTFSTREKCIDAFDNYIENIRPAFRVKSVKKLDEQQHLYDFHLPKTHSFYGNGFIQHNSQSREVFENVVAGFGAVRSGPVDSVKDKMARNFAKRMGYNLEEGDKYVKSVDNQIIFSGTAYYDFNHFAEYWKRWKKIIRSKGDKSKLEEVFGNEESGIPEDFDWRDYSIIRLPYELLPKGFMDEAMVARSKATVHAGIYSMEFSACEHGDTEIVTNKGVKQIKDIVVGDKVLTHTGSFKKVSKLYCRPYRNKIVELDVYGYNRKLYFTPEHPFLTLDSDFEPIKNITNKTYVPSLQSLSNIKIIDARDYCANYMEGDGFIYSRYGGSVLTNDQLKYIKKLYDSGYTKAEISNVVGVCHSGISWALKPKKKTKGCIPTLINLDYDFGICMGYYASEGSIGSGGGSVGFALDGHIDKGLEFFVNQLETSLFKVFGIKPKKYNKKDNTISININSKLVASIFKTICPGICYDKVIDPKILFSNPKFMKGFITGFWNGDGHINDKFATCGLANRNLLVQLKICLTYFGVSSSIMDLNRSNKTNINGRWFNQAPAYKLNISGTDYKQFKSIFYNEHSNVNNKRDKIFNNGVFTEHKIRNKKLVDFDGFVYNLEVEDDHSYCTLGGCVHNCFSTDSNGFFKRSLIESCVLSKDNIIKLPSGEVNFTASLKGKKDCKYIYGIDPASEIDNFSIVILEHYPDHRRVVYVWTTNRKEHVEKVKAGIVTETDFYSYCARKIRDLMTVFPCERIALDSQGGGIAISEALHDKDKLRSEEETMIWPVIDHKKPQPSDGEPGLHIIEMINFSSAEWTSEANHGLRKDFEDKACIFPYFDSVSLGLAKIADEHGNRLYDTLEDCLMEIEELKNELSTIVITQTPSGRDHWDTPEIKLPGNKKGRLRKDRYSSLIMANMVSRQMARNPEKYFTTAIGGWAGSSRAAGDKRDYVGADWLSRGLSGIYE